SCRLNAPPSRGTPVPAPSAPGAAASTAKPPKGDTPPAGPKTAAANSTIAAQRAQEALPFCPSISDLSFRTLLHPGPASRSQGPGRARPPAAPGIPAYMPLRGARARMPAATGLPTPTIGGYLHPLWARLPPPDGDAQGP